MSTKELSFGIVCLGTTFPAWQAKCIRSLIELKIAEPKVLILKYVQKRSDRRIKAEKYTSRIRKKITIRKDFLFSVLLKIDKKLFKPKAWNPTSLDDELIDVPILKCGATKKGKYSQYFDDEAIRKIKEYKLDFILYFDFNIIRGEFLNSAKYGVWSFHHDDEQKYRGGSAGIWEIYFNDPECGLILQRLTNKLDAGFILNKKKLKTIKNSISLNYEQLLLNSVNLLTETCRKVLLNPEEFEKIKESTTNAPIYKTPSNFRSVLLATILLKNNLLKFFKVLRS